MYKKNDYYVLFFFFEYLIITATTSVKRHIIHDNFYQIFIVVEINKSVILHTTFRKNYCIKSQFNRVNFKNCHIKNTAVI